MQWWAATRIVWLLLLAGGLSMGATLACIAGTEGAGVPCQAFLYLGIGLLLAAVGLGIRT